ncbi:MAG: hypothetical protein CSA11_01505 [Chloroflexi bacterium]|nr:MAG: hypothetical protein CSB13_05355 [Chloroflexota bacterium]PIE82163.1 MAG: hypothetical protein CSA11_01505 [Chloroflexota bacterium]
MTEEQEEHEYRYSKRPLSHAELTDIIDLCLWAGQMLLQYGANSFRVEESTHRFGTGLGCDWLDIIVRTESITVTASSGGEFRTKTRRVVGLGVNMACMAAINTVSREIERGELDRVEARRKLEAISHTSGNYNRWVTVGMVGIACGAFSQLFGGDWHILLVTFVAASVAMFVRQEGHKRQFNPFIVTAVCAVVAGLIASVSVPLKFGTAPEAAMTACVLLLVPGVPLINATHDFLRGYMSNGITRGVLGFIISMCIALGLMVVLLLTGESI